MQYATKIRRIVAGTLAATLMFVSGCTASNNSATTKPTASAATEAKSLISQGKIDLNGTATATVDLTKDSQKRNKYVLELSLDVNQKTITGKQSVSYINNTDISLSEVCFHLYPNSFKTEEKVPVASSEKKQAYPNGFSSGYITLTSLKAGGQKASFTITGEDSSVLKVKLPTALKKAERVTFEFEYTVKLPNYLGRFGYGEKSYNLCNFYPIASVYDERGFNNDPYYEVGDPFYSDVADYSVKLTVPSGFTVATSGVIKNEEKSGNNKVLTIEANAVRDYAAVVSNQFKCIEKKVNNTTVYSYYYDSTDDAYGKLALTTGAQSIELYEKLYGDYPYSTFCVVQTDFYIGGMEYPNIILIDQSLYEGGTYGEMILKYVIAHETAHQWWYAMVGNNEVLEPWLDEALTDFTTQLYFRYYETAKYADAVYDAQVTYPYTYYKTYLNETLAKVDNTTKHFGQMYVDMPTYWYYDNTIYSILVYSKGVKIFDAIRAEMGDQAFFTALRKYYSDNALGNVSKDDLISAFSKASGKNMADFINGMLRGDLPSEKVKTINTTYIYKIAA